jgi:HlyD family secretion protein
VSLVNESVARTARRQMTRLLLVAGALVVGGLGVAAYFLLGGAARQIPTARVERGAVELEFHTWGELRSPRTSMLVAPPVSGTLQIVRLAHTGVHVQEGDIVLEFDPSEQEYNLEQARSRLLEAEQQIRKSQADSAVREAQDEVELLKARFDVRRAELEVQRNELVSEIDARKNLLNLEEARRRLAQLQEDIKSRQVTNQASVTVMEERRNEARLAMAQAQRSIDAMRVAAPMTGVVSIRDNQDASGGMFFPGMVLPEYREGDLVFPGRIIADVFQADEMEVQAKIDEQSRASVTDGLPAEFRLDAHGDALYRGEVRTVAGTATRGAGFGMSDPVRQFDVNFDILNPDARLRPGATVQIVVRGSALDGVLHLPRQALFEKDGKPVVFVRRGEHFEQRQVKVTQRTESRVVIEGLEEGTEVALADPARFGRPVSVAAAGGGGGRP